MTYRSVKMDRMHEHHTLQIVSCIACNGPCLARNMSIMGQTWHIHVTGQTRYMTDQARQGLST